MKKNQKRSNKHETMKKELAIMKIQDTISDFDNHSKINILCQAMSVIK